MKVCSSPGDLQTTVNKVKVAELDMHWKERKLYSSPERLQAIVDYIKKTGVDMHPEGKKTLQQCTGATDNCSLH